MRIAIITPYYLPVIGGITTFVRELKSELVTRKENVIVITKKGLNGKGIHVIDCNSISFSRKAYSILRQFKPDVIHAQAHWCTLTPAILYKKLSKNVRVIYTFHTEPMTIMRGVKKNTFQYLLSKCDEVTFVSRALEEKIISNLSIKGRKSVIHPGVKVIRPDKLKINKFINLHSIHGRSPVLSFIGPLEWKNKVEGVKILFKAAKIISEKYPKMILLIIGDGKYRTELVRRIVNLGLEENVIITGFLDDVRSPLAITDIYVHISLQEGLPIALLEAMSNAKPVIATKVGGIPEVINDGVNGVLVDAEPEKIAEEVMELLNDRDEMKVFGCTAHETVTSKFTWKITTDKFMMLYGAVDNRG